MNKEERFDYNYSILCTYKYFEQEDEDLALICYQQQLMQIFNIQTFDESIVNSKIHKFYDKIKHLNNIQKIIALLSNKSIGSDILSKFQNLTNDEKNIIIFQLLFSYDYFYLFHKHIAKYFNNYLECRENLEGSFEEFYKLIDK